MSEGNDLASFSTMAVMAATPSLQQRWQQCQLVIRLGGQR
jgi:hypothetical protein